MNEQTPYLSRRELRQREAQAAAGRASESAPELSSQELPGLGMTVRDVLETALDAPATAPVNDAPAAVTASPVSSRKTAHVAAPVSAARPDAIDEDTAVRASRLTRARMARAVETPLEDGEGKRLRKRSTTSTGKRPLSLQRGRKFAPFIAAFFVGGLALVTALPANADLGSTASNPASTLASGGTKVQDGGASAAYVDGQQLAASGGQSASSRDGVSATNLRASFGGHTAATYVNDPNGTIQWPFAVTVPISDLFGWRVPPCAWCSADHHGVDFDPGEGYPIQDVADGVVTKVHAADDNGDGMYVEITHDIDGLKFMSRYCHLPEGGIFVQEGQAVKVGQIIAIVGNTGASTGAHLHFEIHVDGVAIDPFAWLTEHAN